MMNQSLVFGRRSLARRMLQVGTLAIVALLFLGAGDIDRRFNALGHGMICACGCNQILLECNHVGCQYSDRMRGELQQMLGNGMSDEAVMQAFVLKYGNTILAAPTTSGFNLVAWVIPFLVLGSATFFAAILVRRWRSGKDPLPAPAAGMSAAALDHFREQARRETEL